MRHIIAVDIKAILHTKRFLITVVVFIASAAFNILQQFTVSDVTLKGGLDLFTFGNVYFITLIRYLAPFIPAFILGPLIAGNLRAKVYISNDMGLRRYVSARALSCVIIGGGIFILSYLIIFIICFIIDPSLQAKYFEPWGLFMDIYYADTPLYIFMFFIYTALFGAIYGLFSTGIGLLTKNSWMAMALPGIVYFSAKYIWPYFDNPLLSWIRILPGYSYDFESRVSIGRRASELGAVLVASVVLIFIGYFRLKKEHKSNEASVED